MPDTESRNRQLDRERDQRAAALGRRMQEIQSEGTSAPVLRRWANACVRPTAARLRSTVKAVKKGDYAKAAELLQSPTFELVEFTARSSELLPILEWMLRGRSPGRANKIADTSFVDDMVLTVMATAVRRAIGEGKAGSHTLNSVIASCAGDLRECVMGQWLSSKQRPSALAKLDPGKWRRRGRMNSVAGLLLGQVRHQVEAAERGEIELDEGSGGRDVVRVIDPKTYEERRLDLKRPDEIDWQVLDLARRVPGEADVHQPVWMVVAFMILCAAQAENSWFELETKTIRPKRGAVRKTKQLVLSEEARRAIVRDAEAWARAGFVNRPMVCPPENGGYLTVKHRKVSAKASVTGQATNAEGTWQWEEACHALAATPWEVNTDLLSFIQKECWQSGKAADMWGGEQDVLIRAEAARHAREGELYFPIFMDFRGRTYTRTHLMDYQGSDLQKGLLRFTRRPYLSYPPDMPMRSLYAFYGHVANCYGDGLDKMERNEGWLEKIQKLSVNDYWKADEPAQFAAAMLAMQGGADRWDQIPIGLDGTCNGLQHLSAMFRDHDAAPLVNLVDGKVPRDLYGVVAMTAESVIRNTHEAWAERIRNSLTLDRRITKRAVMVLPYGGTLNAVEEYVTEAVLAAAPAATPWQQCLRLQPDSSGEWCEDEDAVKHGYMAFKDRALEDHPLFKRDMNLLSQTVWSCIVASLPRAMAAMDSFRAIGAMVGENVLEWEVDRTPKSMTIRQAKSKSSLKRTVLRGLHLPKTVRTLAMLVGRDQVDKGYHRTGIVANFIHSHDAHHLHMTAKAFNMQGLRDFASIHDQYSTRLFQVPALEEIIRDTFAMKYAPRGPYHPLSQPLSIYDAKSGKEVVSFVDWWEAAHAAGCPFPEAGNWEPSDVLQARWFFH